MKRGSVVALCVLLGLFLILFAFRRPIFVGMAARNYHKRIALLESQIGPESAKEGHAIVDTVAAGFRRGADLQPVLEPIRRGKQLLTRMVVDAGHGEDIRDEFAVWLTGGREVAARLNNQPLPERPTSMPSPEGTAPPPAASPNWIPPQHVEEEPDGSISLRLSPKCYGPCRVYVRLSGLAQPTGFTLKPGQIQSVSLVGDASVEMEATRSYCAAPPMKLQSTMIGQTIDVGCRTE